MEKKLLELIEHNAKLSIEEIANELKASPNDIVSLIADLESRKVICGYDTIINWDKVTEERIHALIEVRVTPTRGKGFDEIAERIYKYPEVQSTYLISGGFDLLVFMEGKTLKEISTFVTQKLSTLESVISTTTHFVLHKYKDHGIILNKKDEDERMIMTP